MQKPRLKRRLSSSTNQGIPRSDSTVGIATDFQKSGTNCNDGSLVCSLNSLNRDKASSSTLLPTSIKSDSDRDMDHVISIHTKDKLNSFRYSNLQTSTQLPPSALPLKSGAGHYKDRETLNQGDKFYSCRTVVGDSPHEPYHGRHVKVYPFESIQSLQIPPANASIDCSYQNTTGLQAIANTSNDQEIANLEFSQTCVFHDGYSPVRYGHDRIPVTHDGTVHETYQESEFDWDIDEEELAAIPETSSRADSNKFQLSLSPSPAIRYKNQDPDGAFDHNLITADGISMSTSFTIDVRHQAQQVSGAFELPTVNENGGLLPNKHLVPQVTENRCQLSFAGRTGNLLAGRPCPTTARSEASIDLIASRNHLPELSAHSNGIMKYGEGGYSNIMETQEHSAHLNNSRSQKSVNTVNCHQIKEFRQTGEHATNGHLQRDLQAAMSNSQSTLPRYQKPNMSSRNMAQVSPPQQTPIPDQRKAAKLKQEFGKHTALTPFLRPKFPNPVPDRSPIQGLNASRLLRTCFRIGEAFKASLSAYSPTSSPSPSNTSAPNATPTIILIELYAFAVSSYRLGHRQFFHFADLFFPTRPPYLFGVWEGWVENPNYECDGRAFLGPKGEEWKVGDNTPGKGNGGTCIEMNGYGQPSEPRMCRVIGTIEHHSDKTCFNRYGNKGEPTSGSPRMQPMNGVTMTVLSIWRAEWSDVEYVKGIVEA